MKSPSTNRRTVTHCWAWLLVCATFPLIWWGGLVTTTGAGMAFRDWLTSDGHWMPFYPWLSSTGDKFVEHGHRLLGMAAGILTMGLVVIAWVQHERPSIRKLSVVLLAGVLLQGLLGGLRVVLDERTLALIHGCTGPLFFALCVAMVVVTSPGWQSVQPLPASNENRRFFRLAVLTTFLAYAQLVAGALVRHSPHLIGPTATAIFHTAVYFHMLLAFALVVHGGLLLWRATRTHLQRGLTWFFAALLGLQVVLGAFTWVVKYGMPRWATAILGEATHANTADDLYQAFLVTTHVAVGSLIFVTSLAIALRAGRQLRAILAVCLVPMFGSLEVMR